MSRNLACSALTLRVRPSGESNREAWFLSAEEGVIRATVFGGPKSRLRAYVAPFHEGKLWLYYDPVRDSRKVTDFDVQFYRAGIRELYERSVTAGAVAETILESHGGGGSWGAAASLASGVLDALDTADAAACSRTGTYFLWQWAEILGMRPDLSFCAACACEAGRDEVLWYSIRREALLCGDCAERRGADTDDSGENRLGARLRLSPGMRLWLKKIETLSAEESLRVTLDKLSLEQAKALSQTVLASALGKRLPTWDNI